MTYTFTRKQTRQITKYMLKRAQEPMQLDIPPERITQERENRERARLLVKTFVSATPNVGWELGEKGSKYVYLEFYRSTDIQLIEDAIHTLWGNKTPAVSQIDPMMAGIMGIMMVMMVMQMFQGPTGNGGNGGGVQQWNICPYCGQQFATLDDMIAHINSAHPDKPQWSRIDIEWD